MNAFTNIAKYTVDTVKKHPQIAVGFAVFSVIGAGMLAYYMYRNRTVRYAKKFVGEREIAGNMGFENEEFDRLMREYGDFSDTQAWCMSFAKMIWIQRAGKRYEKLIEEMITPSTQTTWTNFEKDKSGLFSVSDKPKKGSIVIWQKYTGGSQTWQGHAGIVTDVKKDSFDTIEGNTSGTGTREGIEVAVKNRKFDWDVKNGLRLKGFIHQNLF